MKTQKLYECKFYLEFTAQRRELRKLWNNTGIDWLLYLKKYDIQALKVSDALKISLKELSITYDILTIFKLYNDLYFNNKLFENEK